MHAATRTVENSVVLWATGRSGGVPLILAENGPDRRWAVGAGR